MKNIWNYPRSLFNGNHFSSKSYLFYTSYSYNSISRYAYRGISAHIPRRDLVILLPLIRARMAASCETTGEYEV